MSAPCVHINYDDALDVCSDCGLRVKLFTSCARCDDLTIEIVEGSAPEVCDTCLSYCGQCMALGSECRPCEARRS